MSHELEDSNLEGSREEYQIICFWILSILKKGDIEPFAEIMSILPLIKRSWLTKGY
jgi:hypothetical protein